MIRPLLIGSLLCMNLSLQARPLGQQQGTSADSRIQQIELARSEKEANLKPETEPKLQHGINWVQNSVPYKLITSDLHGFGFSFGHVGPGAGLAIGPQYSR